MNPVANARMYSVNATTQAAWRQVLAWVLEQAGLPRSVIDHDPPAPMNALWARPDLGMALMCGLPRPVVDRLSREITAIVQSPEFRKKYDESAAFTVGSTPEELGTFARSETSKWTAVVRQAGIAPN